jgi:hypothetical protein
MKVPEIIAVKEQLENLKQQGLLQSWELPYENLLTRKSAAIFFVTPSSEASAQQVWDALGQDEHFVFVPNEDKKLSQLQYKVMFSKEEKEKLSKKEAVA